MPVLLLEEEPLSDVWKLRELEKVVALGGLKSSRAKRCLKSRLIILEALRTKNLRLQLRNLGPVSQVQA